MIETLVLNRESRSFSKLGSIHEIRECRESAPNLIWVDVRDPSSADFDALAHELNLHPLAIEDCRHRHQRPKVDEYQGYYFLVVYEAEFQGGWNSGTARNGPFSRFELCCHGSR